MPIRVLVVDDSTLMRQMLADMLQAEPEIEVVGSARNGREGVQMAEELKPDVITLDVEMPIMNGLEALREIMAKRPTPVIMVSTLTAAGTSTTMEALTTGAVDFICKPNNGSLTSFRQIRDELVEKIRAARNARVGLRFRPAVAPLAPPQKSDHLVVVACSTGGPRALTALFSSLPKGFPDPILIVQHMPPGFVASLAKRLHDMGTVPCFEGHPGDRLVPGHAIIAPSGTHMKVRRNGELDFSSEPTLHGVRPAADYLFISAAQAFGSRCLGVVLSGMGRDGAEGARTIRTAGGTILVESEETCTIYGMPKATVALGAAHAEVPIDKMAGEIVNALARRSKVAS